MSDTPPERTSNSQSNLIEVQHVGVTAKLQSPLKGLLQISSSSTETDNGDILWQLNNNTRTKYNKLSTASVEDTEDHASDASKILYEMHVLRGKTARPPHTERPCQVTPSKIEFQLYNKPNRKLKRPMTYATKKVQSKPIPRQLFNTVNSRESWSEKPTDISILRRLRNSLKALRPQHQDNCQYKPKTCTRTPIPTQDTHVGIYPFEHGSAEFLRTFDSHPQNLTMELAERTTQFTTRFWAEFFGSLHIGVAFVVTFLLQSYRFLLFSLVNTLIVGILQMTSDYLLKPLLTIVFNGYIQPPFTLMINILTAVRDMLAPIADTLNNFMKPVATVGKSLRLINATYNNTRTSANHV